MRRKALVGIALICLMLGLVFVSIASAIPSFNINDTVEVQNTGDIGLRVRDSPAGNITGGKFNGDRGVILEGPRSAALGGVTYTWWKIRWVDGLVGWSAEGYPGGVYYLKKITTPTPTPPTVETRSAVDIAETVATINGRVISDGGSSIVERRFDWGTTSSCADGWTASVSVLGSDFSYRLSGLNPGTTYYFRAWAKNSAGWGQGSVLSFTTQTRQDNPPNVNSFSVSPSSVTLGSSFTISYSVSDEIGLVRVELWRADDSGGTPVNWGEVKRTSVSGKSSSGSFSDAPTSSGFYWYGVHVVDSAGKWNDERNANTGGSPGVYGPIKREVVKQVQTPPSPPRNLRVMEVGSNYIKIAWDPPSSDGGSRVTNYKIFRGTYSGGETPYTTISSDWTTFNNTANVVSGTTYYYKVKAVNAIGDSAFSNGVSSTPPQVRTSPSPPRNLRVMEVGSNYIKIAWDAPSSDGGSRVTHYKIFRGTYSGGETPYTTISSDWTTFNNTANVVSGTTYYYKVKAVNAAGDSDFSNGVSATVPPTIDTVLPTISITHPSSGQNFTTPSITVSGTASDNVALSKVEVRVGSGSWQLASGTTSWSVHVTLSPSSNTLYAKATDTSGNIKETSVTVNYKVSATNEPKWIIVHHTAGSLKDTFEDVNRWHKERWPNFVSSLGHHIGYHYFIDATGKVTQGRAENEEGAHTIGKNTESIGICLAGNFSRPGEMPTEAQERKSVELIREIQKRWDIPNENIVPHRKFAATECYGKNLDDYWVQSLFKKYGTTPTISEDVYWLAKTIVMEAGGSDIKGEERIAVGWTVLNRLDAKYKGLTTVKAIVEDGYKPYWKVDRDPTSEIVELAKSILEREIQDPTDGATHFFSPRSMERDKSYGPYKVLGTNIKVLIAWWAIPKGYSQEKPPPSDWEIIPSYQTIDNTEWVSGVEGLTRYDYFMFYRPIQPNKPPVADFTYYPESPAVNRRINFDASSSTDPDGKIISYRWDFGDGFTASGVKATHSYYKARTYTVTLTVTDDKGTDNRKEIAILIPLYGSEAISPPSSGPPILEFANLNQKERADLYKLIKQVLTVEQAKMAQEGKREEALFNSINLMLKQLDPKQQEKNLQVKDIVKEEALSEEQELLISLLGGIAGAGVTFLTGAPAPFLDEGAKLLGFEIGEKLVLKGLHSATIKYPKIGRMEIVWHEQPKNKIWVNIYLEEPNNQNIFIIIPVESKPLRTSWSTYICSPMWCGITCPPEAAVKGLTPIIKDVKIVGLHSPGELRVYDSQNRVTGLVNGEVKEEIPNSIYDTETKTAVIFSSTDSYHYEVAGTDEGAYGLEITSVEEEKATTFTATNIPTSAKVIHQYTIDFEAIFRGEEKFTLQIDANGDGVFEQNINSGNELNQTIGGIVQYNATALPTPRPSPMPTPTPTPSSTPTPSPVPLERLSVEISPKNMEIKPGDTVNYKIKLDWKPETWEGEINAKIIISAFGFNKTYEYPSVPVKGLTPPIESTIPITIPDNAPPLTYKATIIVEADGKTVSDKTSLVVKIPAFEAVFAIAGLLAVAYLMKKRR